MKDLKGVWLSLITPFDSDNKFDAIAAQKYIQLQNRYNFAGFLIGGTVGEGILLSNDELAKYIAIVRQISKKPIMLCIAAFSYNQAIERLELDHDYLCITAPIYFKPQEEAVIKYFKMILKAASKKIMLYNNPIRVCLNLDESVYEALYNEQKVFAVKECNSDQFNTVSNKYPNWLWMTGEDSFAANSFFLNNYNACGIVSTLANIAPDLAINLWQNKKDTQLREQYAKKWAELCSYAYSLPNPQAIKLTLADWGIIKPYFRAPFSPLPEFDHVHHFLKPNFP